MENSTITIEKVAFRYGLITTGGLVVYFLLMRVMGLAHIIELRTFNLFILLAGIWYALRYYQHNSNSHLDYFEGIGLGSLTSAIAVIPFSVFMFFFMIVDTGFMEMIRERADFGQYLNPYLLSFIVTFEGVISGIIASFMLMQYLKKKYLGSLSDS